MADEPLPDPASPPARRPVPEPGSESVRGPVPPDLQLASLGVLYKRLVRDQSALVDFVAVRLAQLLPGAVTVKRRGLLRGGPVQLVTVTLGDATHELRIRNGTLTATRGEAVGGVMLRHQALRPDEWVASLLVQLERWASDSDAARAALEQLSEDRREQP